MGKKKDNDNPKPVKVWKRKNIHLVNEENDIKFRGPLSYRHLRIAGWLFLLISQIGVILTIASNMNFYDFNPIVLNLLKSASSLMAPLFLFAAFSLVLTAKDGYRRLLITYTFGAIVMYLLFVVVFLHFGVGLLTALSSDYQQAFNVAYQLVSFLNIGGAFSFNIFIDLLLCALVTFFINYRPTEHFQGKKIYIFRAFVILPLAYEIASITVKMLASSGVFAISPFVIPLLTTKPPVAFLLFVVLALFIKNREKFYIKHGKTHEEYNAFLNTNVNRLHFALFLAFAIVAAVILDIVLAIGVLFIKVAAIPSDTDPAQMETAVLAAIQSTYNMGFGGCLPMLLIVPLIIFFDYTKAYKNKMIDIIIPAVGLGLIALVYVEGLFELIRYYLGRLAEKGQSLSDSSEPAPTSEAVNIIKNIIQ